jgi:multisubunit Na+/H+ antiporter MnhF subunit
MKTINLINSISDLIIAVSLIFFLYFVYRENGMIQKVHVIERLFVRIALALGATGALYDFLTTSNKASVLIHLSFAMIFSWAAYFHYKYIINKE